MSYPDEHENLFESVGARHLAAWTLNLLTDQGFKQIMLDDPHTFSMAYAACASASTPPPELIPERTNTAIEDMLGEKRVMQTFKDLTRQFGQSITGKFAENYELGYTLYSKREDYSTAFEKWHEEVTHTVSGYKLSVEDNVDYLSSFLDLNAVEKDLLVFQAMREQPGFKELFNYSLSLSQSHYTLAKFLGYSRTEIIAATSEDSVLMTAGLIHCSQRPFNIEPMSRQMTALLVEKSEGKKDFISRFVRPLENKAEASSLARFHEQDQAIVERLLTMPIPEHPVNILVYSSKAINKKELLFNLLKKKRLRPMIANVKNISSLDIPAVIYIAQRYLEQENKKTTVLIIDKAEQAFTKRDFRGTLLFDLFGTAEDEQDAVELEQVSDEGLLKSKVRCVWMTNSPHILNEENLAKFLYHCEALPGSRRDRRNRIESVIKEFDLSAELKQELSKYNLLGEMSVRQAASVAAIIEDAQKKDNKAIPYSSEEIVRRAIQQSQTILMREETEDLRDSVTEYSLDNLNLSGPFQPQRIVEALKKRPRGTLCLYGIPGAGKTQLAEYIALEIDKPLIIKRASDLLSKWLGESEQNIASMFREAEEEGAILFLDEADSFLRDRSLARAEWSVTQVNELLQQMERFPGIFIAATNLFQDIDAAALRRFSWKLEFLPLKDEQAWRMFCIEAGLGEDKIKQTDHPLYEQLTDIQDLAPGDFATVKRQAIMLGEDFSPEEWLDQLEAEAKAKMIGLKRNQVGI